jgi:hypothetical protein
MGTAGFLRGPDEVVVDVGMRVIDAGPTQQPVDAGLRPIPTLGEPEPVQLL